MKVDMFIDDLAEFFLNYEKVKPRILKLEQRMKRALVKLNQRVHIRDLVVTAIPPSCYGEAKNNSNVYSQHTKKRLYSHISFLFNLANEDHRANYCERSENGRYQLKKGKENHVTRLSMNEFSLYTARPLTLSEFETLYRDVLNMAETLEPNVHILLSSFAIQNNEGKILNMSLFVEGGKPPSIHSFAKNTASNIDIDYSHHEQLFSQQEAMPYGALQAENIISGNGTLISTGSVFEVRTQGGAYYTQTIDVCLDHAYGHSLQLMRRRLLNDADPDEFLPEQIEQCITSNSIDLNSKSIVANKVLHADTYNSMHGKYGVPLGRRMLTEELMRLIIPKGYEQMAILNHDFGYKIINPAFGSDCIIEVLEERAAGKYKPYIKTNLLQHNQDVCERKLLAARQIMLSKGALLIQKIDRSQALSRRIDELEQIMFHRCRPGWLQRLFHTEEYKQKMAAKEIITQSFSFIKSYIEEHGNAAVFGIRGWKKDLDFRLMRVGSTFLPSAFKIALSNDIKTIIDVKLQNDLGCEFDQDDEHQRHSNSF